MVAVAQLVLGGEAFVQSLRLRLPRSRGGRLLALTWHLAVRRLGCVLRRHRRRPRHLALRLARTRGGLPRNLTTRRLPRHLRLLSVCGSAGLTGTGLTRLLRCVGSVGHVGETSLSIVVMSTASSDSCRSLPGTASR
nr:hypothetical protein GCM10023233_17860 [Brevibacterium otitidis]